MPIYEYLCDACGEIVSALQKISDSPLAYCPSGAGGGLKRVLSAHAVVGVPSGSEASSCEQSEASACGGCGQAGTGCS